MPKAKKKPESPGGASKARVGDTGPDSFSSPPDGQATQEYGPDADSATDLRASSKRRSMFSEPAEISRAKKHFLSLAYDDNPPKIARTPVFVTLAQAIDELAGKSKSKTVRDKARREILKDLKDGKLKLDGYYVRCMPQKTKRNKQVRLKAKARRDAMREWTNDRDKTVRDVAKSIGAKEKFSGVAERTIESWVRNLKPK